MAEQAKKVGGPKGKRNDDALVIALASGLSTRAAAEQAGFALDTVTKRLKDPGFQARLTAARDEFFRAAADRFAANLTIAQMVLLNLLGKNNPAHVRLAAAKEVLALALSYQDNREVRHRMAEVERQLGELRDARGVAGVAGVGEVRDLLPG